KRVFLPYLQRQLEIIQPKVVVTLGRHSMNCFLPDLQISKCHGQPKRIKIAYKDYAEVGDNGSSTMQGDDEKSGRVGGSAAKQDGLTIVILPLFHPAAALYDGSLRQTLIDDFAEIPLVLEKISK
ncbi:MAG TPA: uracil-DNA glycosylase family protein, partial [Candidatus Saccharimonadales bacterium]